MSLLFFLKPAYPPFLHGWVEKRKPKRKKVYRVVKEGKQIFARPVDWVGFAQGLFKSRKAAQEARDESDLILLKFLLGEL